MQSVITTAGNAGGAYLEKLGKTDLAKLTQYEWGQFIADVLEAGTKAHAEGLRALADSDVPF